MPRYFFDVETDEQQVRDEIGMDLLNPHAIWPEIARLVHDCCHTAPFSTHGRTFNVIIRDEAGCVVERSMTRTGQFRA